MVKLLRREFPVDVESFLILYLYMRIKLFSVLIICKIFAPLHMVTINNICYIWDTSELWW